MSSRRIVEQLAQPVGQGRHVVARYGVAALPMLDHLRNRPRVSAYARQSEEHRLEDHDAEGLEQTREAEHVGVTVGRREARPLFGLVLVQVAKPFHAGLGRWRRGWADDDQASLGTPSAHAAERFE